MTFVLFIYFSLLAQRKVAKEKAFVANAAILRRGRDAVIHDGLNLFIIQYS